MSNLVEVMIGTERSSATALGDHHFTKHPAIGERVDIDAKSLIVVDAWHRPSTTFAGSKFTVVLNEHAEPANR